MTAAGRLWWSKGFEPTTVADICAEAGVSKGTFYFYFPHKEDLLVELALATAEEMSAIAERLFSTDASTEEVLKELITHMARGSERTPRELLGRTMVELFRSVDSWDRIRGSRPDLHRTFAAALNRGKERGEIDLVADVDEVGSMLSVVLLQGMFFWSQKGVGKLENVLWGRARVVLRGISLNGFAA